MAYTTKLANPTPWDVKIDWDRGIRIRIPAFSHADLTSRQAEDFVKTQPGSDAVQEILNYHGLFLVDPDRPYDNQALEALTNSRNAKKNQFESAYKRLVDSRAATGMRPDENILEEILKTLGLITIREKVQVLEKQISKFREAVGPGEERNVRPQLDPARTILVTEPPREFPSVAAMKFFLDQNPEIKVKHEAFTKQLESK